ncbi:MAG: bifunctional demethylmenaquinone methyltransferase/2-methoxy-6-polyprenyl-1,4-benzoquinol methylase UbiE [Bacteroidales bacterium]|nr:bifunctional demethylmenaquinone methyltransferase/2-methoxy-6-polyprenyl-1,4-benzoquinol methylase UbiE [Bacteroidales bacterium]
MENNPTKGKKEQVRNMFNNIASDYDFLNHFLSIGIDRCWRKITIDLIKKMKHDRILDVATGTADLAIRAAKIDPKKIIGVDISDKMLEIGRKKIRSKNLEKLISLQNADSENLPFPNESFDIAMAAFGVRNFEDLNKGISEMFRVINSGGAIVVLEFSKPQKFPFKQIYFLYFQNILPFIGKIISKNKTAYSYLPESVSTFPSGTEFLRVLKKNGFINNHFHSLTMGVASVYVGKKQ